MQDYTLGNITQGKQNLVFSCSGDLLVILFKTFLLCFHDTVKMESFKGYLLFLARCGSGHDNPSTLGG